MTNTEISLEVVDRTTDHFLLTFARPGRVEISLLNGKILVHVYEGTEVDTEQRPLFAYDGTQPDNESLSR